MPADHLRHCCVCANYANILHYTQVCKRCAMPVQASAVPTKGDGSGGTGGEGYRGSILKLLFSHVETKRISFLSAYLALGPDVANVAKPIFQHLRFRIPTCARRGMAYKKSQGRSKKKGKQPTKREQAQMLALRGLGMGTYEVGQIMGRSPHTIRKYCESPMFTDPKFKALVEEYKEKELLDLTAMNISARARIHDLIPTMTPIEAIACMDKSFQQRRLIEGKSTENVFSLRKIISEAHGAQSSVDNRTGSIDSPQEG